MADETNDKKGESLVGKIFGGRGGALGGLLEKIGIRGVMYQLGGRKAVAGGGALGIITLIVNSDMTDWPKAIACGAVAITAAALMFSISSEDSKKSST